MRTAHKPLRTLLPIVTSLLLSLGSAVASPTTKPATDTEAKEYYKKGELHYAAGRYKQAAEKFERAYAITKKPGLLFNIGNAYERMGAFDKAAASLRQYLQSPDAKGRQLISERIGRLEAANDQKKKEKRELMEAKLSQSNVGNNTGEAGNDKSNVLSYVFLGTGVAAVITGVALGVMASKAGDDAETNCQDGYCTDAASSDLDKQSGLALGADIAFGIGAAAIITGTVLLVMNLMGDEEHPQAEAKAPSLYFHAGPTASGAAIGLGGTF